MKDDSRIRILCVDDHAVVREGITALVDMQPDMEIVACAVNGDHAIELFRQHQPDITLMDLQLPRLSGLEAIRAIRQYEPKARIIVLTMYHGDEDIFRALQTGAASYLTKDTLSDELVRVIRQVHAGERPVSTEVAGRLAGRPDLGVLTQREVQVVELLGRGLRNKEIAAALGISEQTARVHMKNVLGKFHVSDRAAALAIAAKRGIVHLS